MKRFQECNWIVKTWRYRHYVYIPFKWLYFKYISPFLITNDDTLQDERLEAISFRELIKEYGLKRVIKALFKGELRCPLWSVLKGSAQGDMNWGYTMEEVKAMFKYRSEDDEGGYEGFIDLEDDVDDTEYWKGID